LETHAVDPPMNGQTHNNNNAGCPVLQIVCVYIQGVPGGKDLTSGECSLGQTIPINPKHLYPKFNGYGDIGQRSLKLAGICGFCNVNICT